MVADAPKIDTAIPAFLEFAGDRMLIAHNANFDTSFIRAAAEKLHKCGRKILVYKGEFFVKGGLHTVDKLGNEPLKLGFCVFHVGKLSFHEFISLGNLGIFVYGFKIYAAERLDFAANFPQTFVGGGNVGYFNAERLGGADRQLIFVKELGNHRLLLLLHVVPPLGEPCDLA